ncbi:MAG: glycosyltransferase family 2 protein [Bacteroidota bacterium]
MKIISICICTRKRQEGLKLLLESIENLEVPPETDVRIIIVENDTEKFSENTINEFSSKSKFKISHYLEPRQGIVYARNRSVKEADGSDFCCFTDDDQKVAQDWLIELVRCQIEFDSDGVSGLTPPVFTSEVPAYIKHFHTRNTYQYGKILKSANTGCLLIRKKYLDLIDGPFDLRLNFTGGEDNYLTTNITKMGGVIRYNPKAISSEIIPESRTTIKFIIKRTFRISNTLIFLESLRDRNFSKLKTAPRLVMRLLFGLFIVIPYLIFGGSNRLEGLIKICRAIGGFSFILGRTNQFYKGSN